MVFTPRARPYMFVQTFLDIINYIISILTGDDDSSEEVSQGLIHFGLVSFRSPFMFLAGLFVRGGAANVDCIIPNRISQAKTSLNSEKSKNMHKFQIVQKNGS